ncbi:MAG: hypothetical protein N2444_07680, partial [Methylocystis sp.]|nr:hypothetical protein [Methylocystis sp.]
MLKSGAARSMAAETGRSGGAATVRDGGPAIDVAHLSCQTFGDHELERELLGLFDRQAAQFVARLTEVVDKSAVVWRTELVHTLK